MVQSLRTVEQQRAQEERRNRLIMARQYGNMLGVESARYYQRAKETQTAAVRSAARAKLVDQRTSRAADVASQVVMAERRRGEAMRAAANLVEHTGQRGQEEVDGWRAEHKLEQMRSDLAVDLITREAEERGVAAKQRAMRREAVRSTEAARSEAVLARSKAVPSTAHNSAATEVAAESAGPQRMVTMASRELAAGTERAVDAAPSYQAAREEQRRQQAERVKGVRKGAQQRACEAVMQRRHDEMLKAQEAARAAALQKELIAAAQKRSGRPGFAEFQEEEARRAQRINHQAHLEFERVFLATDGWTVRDVQRAAAVEALPDSDGTAILFDEAQVQRAAEMMVHCAYPLPCRPILPAELTTPMRSSGTAADAGDDHDEDEGVVDMPSPSEQVPTPQPALHHGCAEDANDSALVAPSDDDDDM